MTLKQLIKHCLNARSNSTVLVHYGPGKRHRIQWINLTDSTFIHEAVAESEAEVVRLFEEQLQ
jgi:hypothetical protein